MKTKFYRYSFKNGWREFQRDIGRRVAMLLFSGALITNVLGGVSAQTITLKEKRASLQQVLEKIRRQANVDLIGDMTLLRNAVPLTIDVQNREIQAVLQEISRNQPIDLTFQNNTIIVKGKSVTATTRNSETRINQGVFDQQEYSLVGNVTDEKGKPLKGVNVKLINSSNWASTTADDGTYAIRVNRNSEVMFSLIGYEQRLVKVDGRSHINVVMVQKNSEIQEVVATGYTTRSREQFTGAATVITRQELEKFNNNNIFSIIQSIDPAFKLDENIQGGSNPNNIPQINIRGISSVGEYAVNAPLVIMDGFEAPLSRLYDMDINRIESISILKDASATSLYGSRGGNGVIVIETRMPKDGKFTVTYDARPSITLVDLSDYNLMNAAEKLEYERLAGIYQVTDVTDIPFGHIQQEAYDNLYATRLNNVLAGVDTYWLKKPVRSTASLAHSLRFEGGRDEVRYSLEGSYNDFKGAMKESGRKLVSGAFNLIYRIPNKFTFRNIASYQHTTEYNSPYGSFATYTRLNPYERMLDENGQPIIRFSELGDQYSYLSFGPMMFNPLYNAALPNKDQILTNALSNNAFVEWFATDNFRITARGSISKTFIDADKFLSPYHTSFYNITDATRKGSYNLSNGESLGFDGNINLQYSNNFNKHQVIGNLIGEIRSNKTTNTSHLLTGFADDRIVTPSMALQYAANSLPEVSSNPLNAAGWVLSGLYSYDNKYNVSVNARWDGSSIYGRHNRDIIFWTTGLRYNMHREQWFTNPVVNYLSLYGNIGISGIENFRSDMALSTYRFIPGEYYFRQNSSVYRSQGNPLIGWPKVEQRSAGMELALWQNTVKVDASLYNNITNDMVASITVAPSLGFRENSYSANLGKVSNKGFEIRTEVRLYQDQTNDLSWVAHLGMVQNRGKLLAISNELKLLNESLVMKDDNGNIIKPSTYYEEGESLQVIRAVPSLGIDPANGREMYRDRNGNVTYTWNANDQVVVGNAEPDLYGNFGTSLGYKGIGATLIFRYSLGGDLYNRTLMDKVENNDPFVNADRRVLEDRWKQPGDISNFKAIDDLQPTQISSRFVQKENFLAFSSLNIFYEVPRGIVNKYKLQRARFNFSSNEMFRASTIQMERGIDYPFARTYNFGVMVQF